MKILSRDLPKRNIRERVKDNIRRFFTEMGQDKVGYLFLAIFGSLLLLICVQDWLFIRQNASDDSAGEFLYMHKVWETGNPFTPAYANNNELFFSRPWFLYVLFYFLTHSIILSSKFTLIFSVILLSICGIYFFRKIGYEWPTVFFALTIFLGLIPSQTVASAFRFFVAYSLFYCGTFVFLAIIIELEQSNKISKIQYVVILGMAVYFGLCGMRMSLCLYLPFFVFQTVHFISAKLHERSFFINKYITSFVLFFSNLIGFAIYRLFLTPYMQYKGQMNFWLAQSDSLWHDIITEFNSILQCLEINFNGSPIFSPRGIHTVFMLLVVTMLLFTAWHMYKLSFFSVKEKAIIGFLVTSGVILYFGAIISSMQLAARYWIVLPILVSVIFAVTYRFLRYRRDVKPLRGILCILAVFGVMLSSQEMYAHQSSVPTVMMQIEQHLEEEGVGRIAGHYWHLNNIVFNSDGTINGMCIINDDKLQPLDWQTDRTQFINDDKPVTVILSPEEKEAWVQSEKRSYLMSLSDNIEEYLGYSLLYYERNPFAFDLIQWGREAKYNFLTLFYGGNAYLDNNKMVLNKDGMQYGPYSSLPKGDYDVVIRGENLSVGTFDAVSSVQAYEMKDFSLEDDKVVYSIHLDEAATGVELRCSNLADGDSPIIIYDITVTPRDKKTLW